jgi:hypothetical protein
LIPSIPRYLHNKHPRLPCSSQIEAQFGTRDSAA